MSTELKGSPKQISWAKKIRTDRLSFWKKSDPILFKEVEAALGNETSASWWITYREKSLGDVLPYNVTGGEMRLTMVKPKAVTAPPPTVALSSKDSFSGLEDVHRTVGELRDMVSGKVVVDPECPF